MSSSENGDSVFRQIERQERLRGVVDETIDELPAYPADGEEVEFYSPRMDKYDFSAYVIAASVELNVAPALAAIRDSDKVKRVLGALERFHSALPYSAAEWRWLQQAMSSEHNGDNRTPAQMVADIEEQRGVVLSDGVTRPVHGAELTERWRAWRQGFGQYAGRAGVKSACEAAEELVDALIPIDR